MNDGKSESVLMQSEKKKKCELCVSYGYICDWLVAFHRVRNLQFPILPIFTNSFSGLMVLSEYKNGPTSLC